MNRKNFCLYPFAALSLDNSGAPRICCHNLAWDKVSLNKKFGDPTFTVEEGYNNPLHKELRRFIINDVRHPSCKKCWDAENEGAPSFRTWFTESFKLEGKDEQYWIDKCDALGNIKDIEFVYLDITFGNKCNLKCVMCNGSNSSLFAKEQFEQKEISLEYFNKLMSFDWFEDAEQFNKLDGYLSSVQRIHILGGEPLLIEHQHFLKKFVDLGISKNIVLSYNSNLTVLPREILELWAEFDKVYLCVSVDAYKELNEFIRFPMKWNKLERNIDDVIALGLHNLRLQIHATFSSLSYLGIPEFLDWVKEVHSKYPQIEVVPYVNYVYSPAWIDPVHLPMDIKKKGFERYLDWESKNQDIINHDRFEMLKGHYTKILGAGGNPNIFEKCLERINHFENVRGLPFPGFK